MLALKGAHPIATIGLISVVFANASLVERGSGYAVAVAYRRRHRSLKRTIPTKPVIAEENDLPIKHGELAKLDIVFEGAIENGVELADFKPTNAPADKTNKDDKAWENPEGKSYVRTRTSYGVEKKAHKAGSTLASGKTSKTKTSSRKDKSGMSKLKSAGKSKGGKSKAAVPTVAPTFTRAPGGPMPTPSPGISPTPISMPSVPILPPIPDVVVLDILQSFFDLTDGPNWLRSDGWEFAAGLSPCFWYGIDCTDGVVDAIDLRSNAVLGNLSNTNITDLYTLKWLDLYNNSLTGSIPSSIVDLSELEYLDLGLNSLSSTIPDDIGNLTNLIGLYLDTNFFTGTIPETIGMLKDLEELFLDFNGLTGSLPLDLFSLTDLEILALGSNSLVGSIVPDIQNLTNLRLLDLGDNQMTDALPTELGKLTELEELYLGGNTFSSTIPDVLGNIPRLRNLILSSNMLTSTIPQTLGNLNRLEILDLKDNSLTGDVLAGSPICQLRLGNLSIFETDCPGEVSCACCTNC